MKVADYYLEVSPAVCRLSGFYRDCACAYSFLRYADNRFILLLEKGADTSANDLARALNEGGYSDGSRQQTTSPAFLEFLDRRSHSENERQWLELRKGQRGGSDGDLLQQPREHNFQQQVR